MCEPSALRGGPGGAGGDATPAETAGRHVVLVGLSGSGKTTVGRLLAARLGRRFLDTDDLIGSLTGRTIPEFFAAAGEEAFRDVERQAVAQAVAAPPAVIATGGGAPVDATNRELLWRENLVVWLDAPVATLVGRLGESGSGRPLLTGDVAERLHGLAAARQGVYAMAHLRLDTAQLPADAVAGAILTFLSTSRESGTRVR